MDAGLACTVLRAASSDWVLKMLCLYNPQKKKKKLFPLPSSISDRGHFGPRFGTAEYCPDIVRNIIKQLTLAQARQIPDIKMTSLSGLMTRATVKDDTVPGETMAATAWQGKQKIEVRQY